MSRNFGHPARIEELDRKAKSFGLFVALPFLLIAAVLIVMAYS